MKDRQLFKKDINEECIIILNGLECKFWRLIFIDIVFDNGLHYNSSLMKSYEYKTAVHIIKNAYFSYTIQS